MTEMSRYNLVATFAAPKSAQRAAKKLKDAGMCRDGDVELLAPDSTASSGEDNRVAAIRAEMQDEVAEGFAGPSIGFFTPLQAKGAFFGTILGSIAGLVLGLAVGAIWGWMVTADISPMARLLIASICFLIGGATIGFIAGGALKPRMESQDPKRTLDDKRLDAERQTVVAVHVSDAKKIDEAQRILEDSGAHRVDAVSSEGLPLPPQAESPRPADPPGRWWKDKPGRG